MRHEFREKIKRIESAFTEGEAKAFAYFQEQMVALHTRMQKKINAIKQVSH